MEAFTEANSVSFDRGAIDRQRAISEAGASLQWNLPPQLESVVVPSTMRDHRRSREQPLLPYDSTLLILRPIAPVIIRSPEGSLHCYKRRRNYTTLDYRRNLFTQPPLDLS